MAAERRAEYYRLRLEGTGKYEAGAAIGVTDPVTIQRYDRWFRAEHPEAGSNAAASRRPAPEAESETLAEASARVNAGKVSAAGRRDRLIAAAILNDSRLDDCPQRWADVARARAGHPETDSWSVIGKSLGLTKVEAEGAWRRLTRSLGHLPRAAGDTGIKDRSEVSS